MARSYYSTVIDAPADRVWSAVRDFNGLATWWSSNVSESHIEDGRTGDAVGAVRSFAFGADRIREHLLGLSDRDRRCSFEFCPPAPFPVTGYVATLQVTPVTDGDRSFVEWWTDFDCAADELDHWTGFFAAEVFAPALGSLKEFLAR
ncbi:MAG: SRPBCC family protein [Micropruina sp.]|nr:SRPBCC family protein [Micropruina sp.]